MDFALSGYFVTLVYLVNICHGQSDYLCNSPSPPGNDVQITLLLAHHYGGGCNKTTPTGIANPIGDNIMRWAARTLPSLSIGLKVIDTCGSVSVNTKAISDSVAWGKFTFGNESNKICFTGMQPDIIAMVTTMSMSSDDTDYTLSKAAIPLLLARDGYHRMESLVSSTITMGYPIAVVSQAIAKLMVAMNWDFITILYSSDRIGIDSYQVLRVEVEKYHICIDQALSLNSSSFPLARIRTQGVIYLGSDGLGYQLLTEHDLANTTWITTLDVRGLNINNGRVYSVLRSEGDLLTDALAIFGEALNMTVNQKGCNSGNMQMCRKTLQFKKKLVENTRIVRNMNMTYTIDDNGVASSFNVPHNPTFDVYRHNTSSKVTTISLESEETSHIQDYPSLCNPEETDCLNKCGHLNNDKYLYIHGDRIIIVAIAIHKKERNLVDRWSCKKYTKIGLFRTEAARFTFNYLLESGGAMDDNMTFGMLVIDSCGDKLKIAGEVYDIISGRSKICDRNGNCLDPNTVVALVGDTMSSNTEQIQTVLRGVPLIQIAYGASSVKLNDRKEYPYFLRTNPPDDLQTHFMVELMKRIDRMPGNSVTAVNLIYTDSLYGRTAAQKLEEFLMKAGICVNIKRSVSKNRNNNFGEVIEEILHDDSKVRLIVVVMDTHQLEELLATINQNTYRSWWLSRGYSFIFSDTWNEAKHLLSTFGSLVKGSFFFHFNTDFKSKTFENYLINRTLPTIAHENPWMSTLEQMVGNCKLRGNFLGTSSTLCATPGLITQSENELFTLHLMKAIMITVNGFKSVLLENANLDNNFDFINIKRWYDTLLRIKVSRTLEGGPIDHSPFTPHTSGSDTYGNGGVGYSIYNIDDNQKYVLVAETGFKLSDTLGEFKTKLVYMDDNMATHVMKSESDEEHCKPVNPGAGPNLSDKLKIALKAIGGGLGLLFIVVVILIIVIVRIRRQRREESSRTSDDGYDHYLSANQLEVMKTIAEDTRIEPLAYPPSTAEQQSEPNNVPVAGADNLGYERSTHELPANLNNSSDASGNCIGETHEQRRDSNDGTRI